MTRPLAGDTDIYLGDVSAARPATPDAMIDSSVWTLAFASSVERGGLTINWNPSYDMVRTVGDLLPVHEFLSGLDPVISGSVVDLTPTTFGELLGQTVTTVAAASMVVGSQDVTIIPEQPVFHALLINVLSPWGAGQPGQFYFPRASVKLTGSTTLSRTHSMLQFEATILKDSSTPPLVPKWLAQTAPST